MDALANWLWQGCAVTLAATVILRVSRGLSATTRYRLWWMTLLLVLLLPVAPALSVPHETAVFVEPSASGMPLSVPLPTLPEWSAALLVMLWSAWVAVSLWRTADALVKLRRAKRSCRFFPKEREARLHNWIALRMVGRRARLVVSDAIRSAAVLGLTSPAIAVAPTVLRELNDQELDQILVHEWAHVQRRDDVARLLQLLVRALAGFHPAVWWIDRQLQIEREAACDDWAINVTGSAKGYAACLTKLASLPLPSPDASLLPAALSSSELTSRILRLLDRHRNTSTRRALAATALTAPLLIGLASTVASVELVVMAMPMKPVASSPVALVRSGSSNPRPATVAETATAPGAVERGARERHRFVRTQPPVPPRTDPLVPTPDSSGERAAPPTATENADRERGMWTKSDAPPLVSRVGNPLTFSGRGIPSPPQHAERVGGPGSGGVAPPSNTPGILGRRALPAGRRAPENLSPDFQLGTLGAADQPGTLTTLPGDEVPPAPGPEDVALQTAKSETPWGAAAGAGVTVGRGSQKAAVATAGFLTRLSKSIAGVF